MYGQSITLSDAYKFRQKNVAIPSCEADTMFLFSLGEIIIKDVCVCVFVFCSFYNTDFFFFSVSKK